MLTAQKENSPLETETLPQRPQTTRSLDRMVTSIEGLRERVQGFTLEQVSEVDQRLRTMSLQLGELQQRLRALAEMKQQMGRLQKPVQQAEADSLEQSRLATLVEPIAVQSITQFGTLLKFRRVIKLLKEAKRGSGVSASADVEARAPVLPKPVEIITEPPKNEQELSTDLPAIQHELPERSTNENSVVVTSVALEQKEGVFDPAPVEMDFEPNEPFSNDPADAIFLDDSTASIQPREIIAEFADTRDEPSPSHATGLIDTDSRMDEAIFEEFKGTADMEVHLAIPETETVETTVQTHTSASEEADFDQRLLDDLIKDYGEFTILPSATPKGETKKEPKFEPTTATPRVNASATVNPASQRNLPAQRKDGELDRKLKKLIKDYGEYDLYSRQSPLKLKTGVVAAFLVLTLIFSGFYFFSSSKSPVPTSASSASRSQSSSDTASKETPPSGETNSGETLSTPSVSNVDVPKPVEAGASQNIANKGTTKKTK
jgi:hypothetical protein